MAGPLQHPGLPSTSAPAHLPEAFLSLPSTSSQSQSITKSAILSAPKKAKLKSKPSRVRFAEDIIANGSPLSPELDGDMLIEEVIRKNLDAVSVKFLSRNPLFEEGDASQSKTWRVKAQVTYDSGTTMTISLILKMCKRLPAEDMLEDEFFKTEIQVYNILTKMEEHLDVFPKKELIMWPKCLGSTLDPLQIAFQDLKDMGYQMLDKRQGLDADHVLQSVSALARFHVQSTLVPGLLDSLPSVSSFVEDIPVIKAEFKCGLEMLGQVILDHWGPEWRGIGHVIKSYSHGIGDRIYKLSEKTRGRFNVMNHGLLWTQNILYKHDNGIPVSAKFVDFQMSYRNCFAWDLTQLLYLNVWAGVRQEYYGWFLTSYQRSFREAAEDYGCYLVPTLEDVARCMDDLLPFALICTAVGMLEILKSPPENYEYFTEEGMSLFFKKEWYLDKDIDEHLKRDISYFSSKLLFSY